MEGVVVKCQYPLDSYERVVVYRNDGCMPLTHAARAMKMHPHTLEKKLGKGGFAKCERGRYTGLSKGNWITKVVFFSQLEKCMSRKLKWDDDTIGMAMAQLVGKVQVAPPRKMSPSPRPPSPGPSKVDDRMQGLLEKFEAQFQQHQAQYGRLLEQVREEALKSYMSSPEYGEDCKKLVKRYVQHNAVQIVESAEKKVIEKRLREEEEQRKRQKKTKQSDSDILDQLMKECF